MGLPSRSFSTLAHVGTFDPGRKAARLSRSYEGGIGLSMSVHPDDWTRIAKLGGAPTHWLTRNVGQDFRLLDAHAIEDDDRAEIEQWAVDNGLTGHSERYEGGRWGEVLAVGPHVRSVMPTDEALYLPEDAIEVDVRATPT